MTGTFDDFYIDLHVVGSQSLNIIHGSLIVMMFSLVLFF